LTSSCDRTCPGVLQSELPVAMMELRDHGLMARNGLSSTGNFVSPEHSATVGTGSSSAVSTWGARRSKIDFGLIGERRPTCRSTAVPKLEQRHYVNAHEPIRMETLSEATQKTDDLATQFQEVGLFMHSVCCACDFPAKLAAEDAGFYSATYGTAVIGAHAI